MAKIRWTLHASEDLESIAKFIAEDSPHYASLFVIAVLKVVERLTDFPRSGRVVSEVNDPNIREIILGSYRIVHRLRGEVAEILTIYHTARLLDPSKLE